MIRFLKVMTVATLCPIAAMAPFFWFQDYLFAWYGFPLLLLWFAATTKFTLAFILEVLR